MEILEDGDSVESSSESVDEEFFQWGLGEDKEEITQESGDQVNVLRHNIVTSPIVQAIYKLRYSENKPLEGLESENSVGDGSILSEKMKKELRLANPDTYEMDLDDDFDDLENDMLKFTSKEDELKELDFNLNEKYEPELQEVVITVFQSHFKINNEKTFQIPSTIRSSKILRGVKLEEGIYDEDSLVVTLSSGYLLLIRFYLDGEVEPYVVQWWKLSHLDKDLPKLNDVGRDVLTHSSGAAIALPAMQNIIRLYYCSQTSHGAMIDKIQNLNIDGTLLHTCFLEPLKGLQTERHAFLFTMVVTHERRYMIRLIEWWLDESKISEHTPLLLNADFNIPIFIFPFNDGVALMMEKEIIIISINNILSADYNFTIVGFSGSFPLTFYKPSVFISSDDLDDEAIIATQDGVLYSLKALNGEFDLVPILRVPKLTNFIIEKGIEGIDLLYSSDISTGGYLHFDELESDFKLNSITKGQVIDRWDNWAPIFDVEVVDKKNQTQELWVAHSKSISQITFGFGIEKQINDSSLRKAHRVFYHIANDDLYLIFAFVDTTLVFRYDQDELTDVSDSGLDLISRSLCIYSIEGVCFQITETAIIISNFSTNQVLQEEVEQDILLADCFNNLVALITEDPFDNSKCRLVIYTVVGAITKVSDLILDERINLVKFLFFNEEVYVLLGAESKIMTYKFEGPVLEEYLTFETNITEPHDLVAVDGTLYMSSRTGEYTTFQIPQNGMFSLKEITKVKISDTPIDLQLSDNHILLISRKMWILNVESSSPPVPLLFKETRERTVFCAISLNSTTIAALRDDGFCIGTFPTVEGPILKTIKIGQVPKRIKYISHLKVFAIITESNLLFCNKLIRLEERLYSKKRTLNFFEDEVPLSLTEWILPSSNKSFRNLIIGCASENGGSLKVIQPKLSAETSQIVEAYEIFTLKTDAPVISVQQLSDFTIIYSSGNQLLTSTYDLTSRNMLEPVSVHTFTTLITDIDVFGHHVLVSTKDYSVTKFVHKNDTLEILNDDMVVRKVTNSLLLDNNVTVTTDKLHCTVTGIQNHQNRFKTYLPFVPRLKRCQFGPPWYKGPSMNRFICYGFGGDIQLYTFLDREATSQIRQYHKPPHSVVPKIVTCKGLWNLDDSPWNKDRSLNVFKSELLDSDIPSSLKDLTRTVYI